MKITRMQWLYGVAGVAAVVGLAAFSEWRHQPEPLPAKWQPQVRTKGQVYPVPQSWLVTEEGKIAHDLVLPDTLPKPVPFDFDKADGHWFWHKSRREVSLAYFRHLCDTEAGEWILEKPKDVEGLYFARPEKDPTDDYLGDVYGPEAPWVEREFQLMSDNVDGRGGQFVRPPFRNYRFVEEPWRDLPWQQDIYTPYIRIFGYQAEFKRNKFNRVTEVKEISPMQMEGINELRSRYGYTWRGIRRPRDR
ncbi:MAG TPA: hypothetical protein VFM34_09350, partial [Moraxellaceae bacterium]|nr:hypothetical protein [Moraxellaceae bacterium]